MQCVHVAISAHISVDGNLMFLFKLSAEYCISLSRLAFMLCEVTISNKDNKIHAVPCNTKPSYGGDGACKKGVMSKQKSSGSANSVMIC